MAMQAQKEESRATARQSLRQQAFLVQASMQTLPRTPQLATQIAKPQALCVTGGLSQDCSHVHAGANGGINGINQAGTQATGLSSASLNAETDTDTSSGKRVGVIPQEQVLPAGSHPLAGSSGVPDPKNVAGTVTTSSIGAQPQ